MQLFIESSLTRAGADMAPVINLAACLDLDKVVQQLMPCGSDQVYHLMNLLYAGRVDCMHCLLINMTSLKSNF